jgi:hypothetical protein
MDLNMSLYKTGLWSCIFIRFICNLNGIVLEQVLKMKLVVICVNVNVVIIVNNS